MLINVREIGIALQCEIAAVSAFHSVFCEPFIALFYLGTAREVKFNLSICIRAEIKSIRLPRVVVSVCYYFLLNPEELALHHPEAIRSADIS